MAKRFQNQVLRQVFIHDSALFLEKFKALIVSDLHIGFEEVLINQGWLIPRTSFQEMFAKLKTLVKELKPETLIINGDLKHEFGVVNKQEWRQISELLAWAKTVSDLVLIKGNHDVLLKPVAKKQGLELYDYYKLGSFFITHGHKLFNTGNCKVVIIGHEHAAVSVRTSTRIERFKAFIKTSWHGKRLILMPAFFNLTEGTDLLQENAKSPYLTDTDLENAELWVLNDNDQPLYFGRWKHLKTVERLL